MNATQLNKLASYDAVVELFDRSAAIVEGLPALSTAAGGLRDARAAIRALAEAQAQPSSGVTAEKAKALSAMAHAAVAVGGAVYSYASKHDLPELAAKVRVTATSFEAGRESDRLTLAQRIHAAATGVVEQLGDYGVGADTLVDLAKKIAAAGDSLARPRSAVGAKKSATVQLTAAFKTADGVLRHQIDPLVTQLRPKNADFAAKYDAARMIVDRSSGYAGKPPTAAPASVASK